MPTAVVRVTVVHAPACHFCEDAERALEALAERYPLDVDTIDIDSAEGRRLVAVHRPAMNPLVLVDGTFFSSGRLPRRKLEKVLARTVPVVSARPVVR
ncbi:glutaredoxin family protein [Georgenia muralis]|uniref:Glutaredoxin-like protein DUF836 n=1 Tax=Georgenia muralis TaxID=154117 RepID=A0A3N5A991_9MICO|nr:glutaredoxin family protein [Georgenia muralis]RPF28221.1 glutaredoxin-like protein DUF836 [Georgenia muralis]